MRYSMFKRLTLLLALCGFFSLHASGCNPYTLPSYESGYVPFTIVNNAGGSVTSSDLYITITGTDPATNSSCIVQLAPGMGGQWYGSLVDATQFLFANSNPNNLTPYSYQVSQFPTQNSQPVIYLPPITNATMYISIGYGMGLNVTPGGTISIQPPQLFTPSDGNYYHLYDNSTFFSIGTELEVQSQYLNGFGLPISIIVSTNPGANSNIQYSGTTLNGGHRTDLFTNYNTALGNITDLNAKAQWAKLPLSFTSASGGGVTQLRLASALSAMNFATSPFDPMYLLNSSQYQDNWIQQVFGTTTLPFPIYIDVSALGTGYNYYSCTSVSGGNLIFTPGTGSTGKTVTIPYPFTTSLPFLNAAGSGTGSFNVAAGSDSLAGPLICSYLSAGFVTGLFPVTASSPSGGPLSATNLFGSDYLAYANAGGYFYQGNPYFTDGSGPWYDLYGAVLHAASPFPISICRPRQ